MARPGADRLDMSETTKATTRQFNAAIRHFRKACRELEAAAGDDAVRIGDVFDLDEEWRAMGQRLEERINES